MADLGLSPLANSYVRPDQLSDLQAFYRLCARVCGGCYLVQLDDHGGTPEGIFSDYAYFSSYSSTWLEHARAYAEDATARFKLDRDSTVIEVASNDGYLLRFFLAAGVGVLGVEPAANVAAVARANGIPTVVEFFGQEVGLRLRREQGPADLVIANNVLAHVPQLNDFVAGLEAVLAPAGVVTIEVPHLLRLLDETQFDTIYHEHFSYFSLSVAQRVLAAHGLRVFDVQELPTHGGSLRIFACRAEDASKPTGAAVAAALQRESARGLERIETYLSFGDRVRESKREILAFLLDAKERKRTIVGYGAPAKGNTLLNYCGIGTDFLDFTVDRNPHKQGTFLPGTLIPILSPDEVEARRPDYLFVLPWNLKDEIIDQMQHIRRWGGQFVLPRPHLHVVP